ncbi:hypothetical protein AB4Z19_28020 [Pseudoduganella sp. RAF19]|uniref:hypothetical protein n=1 Tax=Pseudoduganella sp. RAF19 TaxID=3233052 RepID=UPI003F9B1825
MGIIDFREIVSPKADHASVKDTPIGKSSLPDDFETFCLDFFTSVRPTVIFEQISTGADNGIDLGVKETFSDGSKIRWLVSCKHKAHSKAAVSEDEEKNILERVFKWDCDGFIPFYTTSPSTKVKSLIEGVEKAGKLIDWYLKDRIERDLLRSAEGIQMAARYFPKSMVNHYTTFIKTMPRYSTSDVSIEGNMASIAGFRHYFSDTAEEEVLAIKEHLVESANLFATMDAHTPYFVAALKDAIQLAPDFFDVERTPEGLKDFAYVSPTWCSYSLCRASLDKENGRGLSFAYFVAAVWIFWDYSRANIVFAESMALRSRSSFSDELTPNKINTLQKYKKFQELVMHQMSKGLLSPGLIGLKLQEEMRDIVTRLFAYANPIPHPQIQK